MRWYHFFVAFILAFITVFCSHPKNAFAGINDNLVSYWKFDEGGAGTCAGNEDVCDSHGSNHGELVGTGGDNNLPQWSDTVKPALATANPYAMNFDGSDDRVTNIGDINFSSNAFSVTAWIRPEAWGASGDSYIHNLLCDETATDSTFCFRIGSKGLSAYNQRIALMIFSNTPNDYESASDLIGLTWTHVAVTFDGSNVLFYINGSLNRTQEANIVMNNGVEGFNIAASNTGERNYDGSIDELRVYDRAITVDEINELATNNPGVNTFLPADNAVDVGLTDNLVVTFDRNVQAIADKYITLKKTSDNSTIETITANDTDFVNVVDTIVTINPSTTFDYGTDYHVLIDTGAFTDFSANNYSGISDATVWNFTTPYSLTYTAGANGSISGSSPQVVNLGSSGTAITAIAAAHYHFVNWSDDSTDNPRADTNVNANISVTANFAIDTYTVAYLAGDHGSITGSASQTVNYGADASSVTATADSGFHFTNWSDSSTANPRTDYGIDTNISITANFAADDTNAPVISAVSSTPSSDSAVITWTTNEDSSSKVQYGLNTSYGFLTDETDTVTRVQSHSVTLTGLKSCARYYYRVLSKDATNNQSVSAQKSFNTTGCTASAITVGTESNFPVTGGTVQLINNLSTVQLDVPDNYAAETATFQINKLDVSQAPSSPEGKSIAANNFYDLIAVTESNEQLNTFDNSITFTVSYGSDTEDDFDEPTLDIYKYDGTTWIKKNCTLDTVNNTLTCSLTGFSTYAVLGQPKTPSSSSTTSTNNSTPSNSSCTSPKPLFISDLFEIRTTPTSAKLFFTPQADTSDFYISFSEDPNAEEHGEQVTLIREGVQSHTVYYLKPNTIYYAKVRGQNGCMSGDWSNILKFKTSSKTYYRYYSPKIISSSPKVIPTPTVLETRNIPSQPPQENVLPVTTPSPSKKCLLWWCW